MLALNILCEIAPYVWVKNKLEHTLFQYLYNIFVQIVVVAGETSLLSKVEKIDQFV
jgi:hypothetical protein